ncbi:MAG TPA: hypothetical protein VLK30_13630, partial [Candidatus Limnocylindrales bacterium]|nr:hypothetical protein [Candidatus Limnocylindrales bacterium]
MLGFAEVYDYEPGKVDWLAHNLPVEGERPAAPIIGRVMRDDAVLCRPTERIADVLESIKRSPYPFALVTSDDRTLLGRAPSSALDPASDRPVWDVAEPGPKTFRPHVPAEKVAGAEPLPSRNSCPVTFIAIIPRFFFFASGKA